MFAYFTNHLHQLRVAAALWLVENPLDPDAAAVSEAIMETAGVDYSEDRDRARRLTR
jgi:hypothetical protein